MEFIITVATLVLVFGLLYLLGMMYMAMTKTLDNILDELKKLNRLLRNLNDKGE